MIESGRDIKIFTGTMDQDTEARYLKEGDYRYLLNGRTAINSQGTFGAVEDVMGNVLVPNAALPPGTNKVIGTYEDIAGQSCIYFVYNSNGFHGIYRWFANSPLSPNGTIEKIYQVSNPASYNNFNPNPLNFQYNSLITGVNLIEDELYFTDNYNEPKNINIKIANDTNKKYQYYFYLNRLDLFTPTTYTFIEVQNGVFINTYNFTSANINFQLRLQDINNQINAANISITSTLEYNYLIINCSAVGSTLLLNDTGINKSRIVPKNFYGTNLPGRFFNRIKVVPFCRPNAFYYPTNNAIAGTTIPTGVWTSGNFGGAKTSLGVFTGIGQGLWGVSSAVNNTQPPITNNINVNAAYLDYQPGITNITGSNYGYISGANFQSITINLQIEKIGGQPTGFTDVYIIVINGNNIVQQTFIGQVTNTNSLVLNSYTFGYLFTPPLNSYKVALLLDCQNSVVTINGDISLTDVDLSLPINIQKSRYLIRSKYKFYNNQESVYSQSTSVVLPTLWYAQQKYIRVLFNDRWIQDTNYLSTIKNVILSYSDDDGVTWYDFVTLYPYQFACNNTQVYDFNNYELGISVPPANAILQYHAVPLKSKSQEYIDNRIFDGGIVEGYDKINVKILTSTNYLQADQFLDGNLTAYTVQAWRHNYSGYLGIVYYDDYDRKSPVIQIGKYNVPDYPNPYGSGARFPRFNAPVSSTPMLRPQLELSIYNQPPDWATKYRIVRTKDLSQNNYLTWTPDKVEWLDANGAVTLNQLAAKNIKIYLDNIPYTVNAFPGLVVQYTYTAGDRIRVISDGTWALLNAPLDAEIGSAIANTILIPATTDLLNYCQVQSIIEIYTPGSRQSQDDLVYYEIGNCYDIKQTIINNNLTKYHAGDVDQDLFLNTPAVNYINEGGAFYSAQQIWFNTWNPGTINLYKPYASQNLASNYIDLKYEGLTRPSSEFLLGQTIRKASIRFTDQFIVNTQINGLNVNQPLNTSDFNNEYGLIYKLQVVNNDVLKLVFGNSYQLSIYVNQGIIRQTAGGGNLISLSDQVAGNSHIIQRTLGTINAESIIVNDEGDMFGYDENEGVVWVSSGNGLIQISDRGMKSVFKRYSNERKATLAPSETPSVYDLYHDEYIITLGDIQNAPGPVKTFPGVTIAYNKQKAGWTAYYSFVPEYYGRVRDYVVSFVKGQLYLHDRSTIAKNFYGTQYTRDLTYVTNKDFPKVRDFKAISINGIGMNDLPTIRVLPFEGYPNGMLSLLTKRFFKVLEGVQYAYFQKDKLTPGMQANQINALANGRNLKGQVLEVTLVNNDTTKSSLYSSEILYFYSEHS